MLCGECKERLAEKVGAFLRDHQARREQARDRVDQFLM
jgi:tryptophanyl-tRNA synthetase